MKIELNESEVKHAVLAYLKETCGVDAAAKDIEFSGYSHNTPVCVNGSP